MVEANQAHERGTATILVVGRGEPQQEELCMELERRGIYVEKSSIDALVETAAALAPDLMLLVGDAATDAGLPYRELLSRSPFVAAIPAVLVAAEIPTRRATTTAAAGVGAAVPRSLGVDGVADTVAELVETLPKQGCVGTGTVPGAQLADLVQELAADYRNCLVSATQGERVLRCVVSEGRALGTDGGPPDAAIAAFGPDDTAYEIIDYVPGNLRLINLSTTDAGAAGDLSELRVLVVAEKDRECTDRLATELRSRGAKVATTDANANRMESWRSLDPSVLVVGEATAAGAGHGLLRLLRLDERLRHCSVLVVPWDKIWSARVPAPALAKIVGALGHLCQPEHVLRSRALADAAFDTRLEVLGPARLLRTLARCRRRLTVTVRGEGRQVRVDLAEGLVAGAEGQGPDGSRKVQGAFALGWLLAMGYGRVHVEPTSEQAGRAMAPNVMAPVEGALGMATISMQKASRSSRATAAGTAEPRAEVPRRTVRGTPSNRPGVGPGSEATLPGLALPGDEGPKDRAVVARAATAPSSAGLSGRPAAILGAAPRQAPSAGSGPSPSAPPAPPPAAPVAPPPAAPVAPPPAAPVAPPPAAPPPATSAAPSATPPRPADAGSTTAKVTTIAAAASDRSTLGRAAEADGDARITGTRDTLEVAAVAATGPESVANGVPTAPHPGEPALDPGSADPEAEADDHTLVDTDPATLTGAAADQAAEPSALATDGSATQARTTKASVDGMAAAAHALVPQSRPAPTAEVAGPGWGYDDEDGDTAVALSAEPARGIPLGNPATATAADDSSGAAGATPEVGAAPAAFRSPGTDAAATKGPPASGPPAIEAQHPRGALVLLGAGVLLLVAGATTAAAYGLGFFSSAGESRDSQGGDEAHPSSADPDSGAPVADAGADQGTPVEEVDGGIAAALVPDPAADAGAAETTEEPPGEVSTAMADLPPVPAQIQRMAPRRRAALARNHVRQGRRYHLQRRYDRAIDSFREALVYEPDNGDTRGRLALSYFRRGEFEQAAAWARRAIEAKPRDAEQHVLLGDALGALRDPAGARAAWEEALRVSPRHRAARRRIERLDQQRR